MTTEKRRVGRPPSDTPKAQEFKISMTPEQMKKIDQAAVNENMGRSQYFRFLHEHYQLEKS